MANILLTFCHLSWQKGSAAQVISFVNELRQHEDDIDFVLLSHFTDLDQALAHKHRVRTAGFPFSASITQDLRSLHLVVLQLALILWALLKKARISVPLLINNPVARAYLEADLVADLSGDSYRDRPGGFSPAHNVHVLATVLLNKPLVLVSQSIGPFRWYNRNITSRLLNRSDLIYVREKETVQILNNLGVDKGLVMVAPDIAFRLPLPCHEEINDLLEAEGLVTEKLQRPWIGISVSCLMMDKPAENTDYQTLMSNLCSRLHRKYGASIILVPHAINPTILGPDDYGACDLVFGKLNRPEWVKVIDKDYSPVELKGIISRCEIFIAARMHAGIAALSSSVPTVLLSWSHKYVGLMQEIGLQKYVWEVAAAPEGGLEQLIDELWQNRSDIRAILTSYNCSTKMEIDHVVNRMLMMPCFGWSSLHQRKEHAPT